MTNLIKGSAIALGVIVAFTGGISTAEAKIKCEGRYQIIKHNGKISTPYCEDNLLAAVARSRGMRVSNKAIRHNPSVKKKACEFVGHDIRVQDICSPYNFRHRRRF